MNFPGGFEISLTPLPFAEFAAQKNSKNYEREKNQMKKNTEKLKKFKSLYEAAAEAHSEYFSDFERQMEQYHGSKAIDGSHEDAGHVRNITYELIESEISPEVPYARVSTPAYTKKRAELAEVAERLLKLTRDSLPTDEINDADERSTYIFGSSILFLEWIEKEQAGKRAHIKIRQISPRDFIPEPSAASVEDMRYCFLRFITTKGELREKYGAKDEELAVCSCGFEYGSRDSDTIEVIYAFYRDDRGLVGEYIFSGDLEICDIPDYYKNADEGENSLDFENVCLHNGDENGKTVKVKKYRPKDFPLVLRKNISAEGELLGASDCDALRPVQQAINKIESRIMQKLLRSAVTPIMPEDATVTLSNAVFGQVIKMKAGESADSYGTVDTTPDISQDIEEADRLYDHAKRLIGISDAYQGIDYNKVESGYAKELRINQAQSRLQSKRRMKITAYSKLFKIIFRHYLAFSRCAQTLTYKDGFGRVKERIFDRHDFIERDGQSGIYYYRDDLIFNADNEIGTEFQRQSLWEKNLVNLTNGSLGDKNSPETLLRYWQLQDSAHYPNAKDNVEFFKELLAKKKSDESEQKASGKEGEKRA